MGIEDANEDIMDHGVLSGLFDDDHPQYKLAADTPSAHASTHQDTGSDEIVITGLSGLLADDQHVLDAEVTNVAVAKTTLDAQSFLAAVSDDTPVALAVAASRILGRKAAGNIAAMTVAELLTLIDVAAGADVTGSNAPQAHKTSHQNGGGDEISIAGLSGLAADDQHVLDAEVTAVAIAISLLITRAPLSLVVVVVVSPL